MFAGTGGLADYSQPEDLSFHGAPLISTPSPQQAMLSSPASTAPKELPPLRKAPERRKRAATGCQPVMKRPAAQPSLVQTSLHGEGDGPKAAAGVAAAGDDQDWCPTQLDPDDEVDDEICNQDDSESLGPVDEAAGPVVQRARPEEVWSEEEAARQADMAHHPIQPPSPPWPKTFAGRYEPKTESGSATWLLRRALYFKLMPPGYQTAKLQLSFWKFCSDRMAATGCSEEVAAQEFIRLGFGGPAPGERSSA